MIKIGSIYNSNNYGPVSVIEKVGSTDYYNVKFLRTGTIKKFRSCQIRDGCIRDPYAKSVCGVACTGDIKTKGKYKPYYSIWHDMINRCYNPADKRYKSYQNVEVSNEWLSFETFYNTMSQVDGFDAEKIEAGELVLDKDLKQRFSSKKIYSVDTCTWLPRHINNTMQDTQQRPFIALSPSGEVFNSSNITQFAREHNLNRKNISGVLHKRARTVKGWRFSYKEIV